MVINIIILPFALRTAKLIINAAPYKPSIIQTQTSSNLLAASVEQWNQPTDYESQDIDVKKALYILSTGADRQLHLYQTGEGNGLVSSFSGLSDSPILSFATVSGGRYVLLSNMSGHLLLQRGTEVLDRRKDHAKYAVKVSVDESRHEPGKVLVATAGWDSKVHVYSLAVPVEEQGEEASNVKIGEPIATITLLTLPESIIFVRQPETEEPILLVSRRDSTYLYYYGFEPSPSTSPTPSEAKLLGKQNLAPHSNAWVAFSPSSLALSSHDPTLLAVATSTIPHMKVIIVRLLFPGTETLDLDPGRTAATAEPVTQASQALATLSLQNREDAAILLQANTFAPQTAYSTPQVVWRPDGSGVWVNGDDGVIRGIETGTGKVVATLKEGHAVGYKVRTVWAGMVDDEEWVVSGGFDKKLIVWRV